MDKIEAAVARIRTAMEVEAAPACMTQADAVEFYRSVADECRSWIETIRQEMGERD